MANNDTPLNQLPNNSSADSDLVNKILHQLDESSTTDVPAVEEEMIIEEPVQLEPPVVQAPPPVFKKNNYRPVAPSVVRNTVREERMQVDNMPTPGSIQRFLGLFDKPEFYYKLKISVFCVILFFIFVLFTDNFKTWFAKLPITTVDAMGKLNKYGLFLQASCFGLVHLGLTIFFDQPN